MSYFLKNKYTKWYYNIIKKASSQERKKSEGEYYEKHHIYPKSIFPDLKYKKENLILLTAREHFICHCLLVKMTSNKDKIKMWFALKYFKSSPDKKCKRYTNARLFELLKNNKEYLPLSLEHKSKISNSLKGKKKQPFSDIHKLRIGLAGRGRKSSNETKNKLSKINKNSMWINDGKVNKRIKPKESINEGWKKGKLQKKVKKYTKRGLILKNFFWITNGIENKKIHISSSIPENWFKGRNISWKIKS